MDPTTVVIMLAMHLICSGGLFYLIGRRMPQRSGLIYWALGSILFGMAYLGRLASGLPFGPPGATLIDTTMVFGALLILAGLRRWTSTTPLRRTWMIAIPIAYAAVQTLVVSAWDDAGRFMLLNLTLAAVYGVIATSSMLALRHDAGPLRPPLGVLALLMGILALLTAVRGLIIVQAGVGSLYAGLWAQIFYAYASLAVVLLGLNLLWMVFVHLNGQLLDLASRDALTRVLNRNGLDDVLARHFSARDAAPLTLLEVDIDHFKRVNDSFGHATGDAVLRAVAATLTQRVRGNDFVARVGGEEFVVGCVGGDMGVALSLGERLRAGVSALQVPAVQGQAPLACTVSIGISRSFGTLADREQAVREADRALYAAKSDGRNRVVAFEQLRA